MLPACNERLKALKFGGLYEIYSLALKLESEGRRIIHMEIGRPDFDSPVFAKEAAKKALDRGEVHYTEIAGIEPLRHAIWEKEKKYFNLDFNYETEISVTAGAAEAIAVIMLTLLDPGDEIIATSPFFSAYAEQALIADVNLVEVPVRMSNGWNLRIEDLEAKITPKTKMLLINSPNNPTGYILNKENLEKIAEIAKAKNLIVISDECYDEFVYEGSHISISSLPGMRERTLIVKSTSKSFSMTGWRIGYVIGPDHMIKYINKVHQNFSTCATAFAQWGAVEAFKHGRDYIDTMVKEFKRRGDYLFEAMNKIERVKMLKPAGAFYAFPDISELGMSEKDFCNYLLNEAGVVAVPGPAFGLYGKGHIRMAYCRHYDDIVEAMEKMKTAIDKL